MAEVTPPNQPGQVISPGGQTPPQAAPAPEQPPTPISSPETTGWQFNPSDQPAPAANQEPSTNPPSSAVQWTASEFIQHDKAAGWYLGLAFGGIVLTAVIYLLTKDKVSTGMVVIATAIFGVFAARRPRELQYQVDTTGIHIGKKLYPYSVFKSFSIAQEGATESIVLTPLKRFMPILTIYFTPGDGQKIVDAISQFLPVEEHKPDAVDRLMYRLRF